METKSTSKKMAEVMSKAQVRETNRKRNTLGLYSFRIEGQPFSLPYFSPDENTARLVFEEFRKNHTELSNAVLHFVGSFCTLDGKLLSTKPRKV